MNKPQITKAILLKDVTDKNTIQWVQSQLASGGYLEKGDVDGIVGPKSIGALKAFKEEMRLAYPEAIGAGTIDALAKLSPSCTLPVVGLVYEDEMIVPDSHITWGEMTRGFTRLPMGTREFGSQEQIVRNMIATAKAFRKVRQNFGSPIRITSAYRPPNLKIGASRSQHKYARALDIAPMNGDYQGLLRAIQSVPEIKGIGLAGPQKGFWHMDIRPIAQRVSFGY